MDAALELADSDGIDALSMPRLAKELGAGTMSLYTHVASKDELLAAMAEQVLSQVGVPPGDAADWRTRVVGHFEELRDALLRHPGIGGLLATQRVAVGAVFTSLEECLAVMRAGRLSSETAARTYYLLLAYTLGFVAWELPRRDRTAYGDAWSQIVSVMPADEFPRIHEAEGTLADVASESQWRHGLEVILRGIGRGQRSG